MTTSGSDLLLIRHAPAAVAGRLFGRTDVAADPAALADLGRLRHALAPASLRVASPALRCRQTADALWTDGVVIDDRLREQDFGAWDGLAFADVPDLGPLTPGELAAHRPPEGESFDDLCERVWPALQDIAGKRRSAALVVHAGTIRAALALAIGATPPALAFEVAPLAVTRVKHLPPDGFAVTCVNCRA